MYYFCSPISRSRAVVACQAHNLKVVGSNPASATKPDKTGLLTRLFSNNRVSFVSTPLHFRFSNGWEA